MAGLLNGMLLAKANFGHDYNPISYKDEKLAQLQARVEAYERVLREVAKSDNLISIAKLIAEVLRTHKGESKIDPTAVDKRATCSGCMGKFTPEEWEKHKYVNCD